MINISITYTRDKKYIIEWALIHYVAPGNAEKIITFMGYCYYKDKYFFSIFLRNWRFFKKRL